MKRKSVLLFVLPVVVVLPAIVIVLLYIPYKKDLNAARTRLEQLESRTIDTPCGPIEYAVVGEGRPVLVVHGNAGGFDQGLDLAAENVGEKYRAIAPSRFD